MNADELAQGRRGARMLLELALEFADPTAPEAYPDLRAPVEVLAQRLAASVATLPPGRLPARPLAAALIATVRAAMYWQPPSEEDDLALEPGIRAALHPLADRLAADPAVDWWTQPLDRSAQYEVRWTDGEAVPPRDPRPVAETVGAWSARARAWEDRAEREWSTDPWSSHGSDWWSAPVFAAPASTRWVGALGGPAALHLVEDGLGWDCAEVTRLHPHPEAIVLEIAQADDWVELCRRHPLEVTAWKRHDWTLTTGRESRWVMPDWTSAAAEYDGVHLTTAAYLALAGMPLPVAAESAAVIAGWAPDTTYWLSDRIERGDVARWTRSSDGVWSPT